MPANFTYLLIDLGAFLVPFVFSFHPKIRFYKEWYAFWPANLLIALLFIVWDLLYTHLGVWGFNDRYILGVKLYNLPLEEILFFICIPYASIFTYHCFKLFLPKLESYSQGLISAILMTGLFIAGIFSIPKLYPSVTFILLSVLIFYLSLVRKVKWLTHFYFMFLVILLPFFIVNGMLTGTGPDAPIVWYNDLENLGIRIATIPVEDIFYGMLLLLLNTFAFESFRRKNA